MNGRKTPPRDILLLILLALTLGTTAYSAVATANYFQFYPALTSLQLKLDRLQWTSTNESLDAVVFFTLENPSDYRGMGLKDFQPSLDITLNGVDTFSEGVVTTSQLKGSLGPKTALNITIPFKASQSVSKEANETWTNNGEVRFVFTTYLILTTFLDRIASVVTVYQCSTTGTPADCQQTDIRVQPIRDTSGGGGGGGV